MLLQGWSYMIKVKPSKELLASRARLSDPRLAMYDEMFVFLIDPAFK